jgi:hypothetical protein
MIDRAQHVTLTKEESAGQLTQRIRNLISTVALDCDCRSASMMPCSASSARRKAVTTGAA